MQRSFFFQARKYYNEKEKEQMEKERNSTNSNKTTIAKG